MPTPPRGRERLSKFHHPVLPADRLIDAMQHRPAISGTQGTRDDIEPARSQSQLAPPQARARSCVHNRSYDCATGRGALSFDWPADRDGVIDGRLSPTAAVGLAAVADYAGGDAGEVRTALVFGLPAAHEYRENGSQMDQSSASAGRWRAQCGSHLASDEPHARLSNATTCGSRGKATRAPEEPQPVQAQPCSLDSLGARGSLQLARRSPR